MPAAAPATANIGCIVLAAGSSNRFGSDKRQYRLADGETLLHHTLSKLQPLFERRVLVLRPQDQDLAALYQPEWQILTAMEASLGMGHSLAAAMQSTTEWEGAVIALADMPWVLASSIAKIRDMLSANTLVVPFFAGQRGNPVGIGSAFFSRLAQLKGDSGARELLQEFSDLTIKLALDDPGLVRDLDTRPAQGVLP